MEENYCIIIPDIPSSIRGNSYPFTILCKDDEPLAFGSIDDAVAHATNRSGECAVRMEVRTLKYSRETIRPDYFQYIYGPYMIGTEPKG